MFNLPILFITSFVITLSGAMMPGPLLTVTIANSAKKGFWEGPLLVLGHGILEFILVISILLGLSSILKSSTFIISISIIGGSILIYMGYDMIKSAKNLTLDTKKIKNKDKGIYNSSIIAGAMVSLANPYWILWWATIGMGYLMSAIKFKIIGIAIFFTGHILADLAWYSLVSFGISKGKKIMKDTTYHVIIKLCGVFLIIFGGYFLYGIRNYV